NLPDATVIINRTGRIVYVNPQAERMFHYAATELLGQPVEILLPKRYHQAHVLHRQRFSACPDQPSREMGAGQDLFGIRKNGKEFPVLISLSTLKTQEG